MCVCVWMYRIRKREKEREEGKRGEERRSRLIERASAAKYIAFVIGVSFLLFLAHPPFYLFPFSDRARFPRKNPPGWVHIESRGRRTRKSSESFNLLAHIRPSTMDIAYNIVNDRARVLEYVGQLRKIKRLTIFFCEIISSKKKRNRDRDREKRETKRRKN